MNICLNMIVGSTNEQYLKFALDNVSDIVNIAVINDNGCNPSNKNRIMESRFSKEDRVVYFESDFLDFSDARNQCLCYTPDDTDWVLKLDADEVVYPDRISRLVEGLSSVTHEDVIRVPFWHLLSWRTYQEFTHTNQFFRYHPSLCWRGRVHETLLLGSPYHVVDDSLAHVHYSYVLSQPEIYAKWVRYSQLEGDPDHYIRKGTTGATVVEDRYALSGAPFFQEHPPGAREYIAAEMKRRKYHDVPLPLAVCIHGRSADALVRTAMSVRDTQNPDYPFLFALFPEEGAQGDWQFVQQKLELTGGLSSVLPVGYTQEALYHHVAELASRRPDIGHFLIVRAGTTFPVQGYVKALVNAAYCLFDCHDAYRPKGAKETILVPRDVIGIHPELLRVYDSPFCLCEEPK